MKVAVIGDIHGTTKFLDCYAHIVANHNDVEKIIVCGDHFDPYQEIPFGLMFNRYQQFIQKTNEDDRIVSLLGNHDLSSYVIKGNSTNRTIWEVVAHCALARELKNNLAQSYLAYKIDSWLFSHAGVSETWIEYYRDDYGDYYVDKIFGNSLGWNVEELEEIVSFFPTDRSGCGAHPCQGCTWIRPWTLENSAMEGYNQVVGHTRVDQITSGTMSNGMTLWLVDNKCKSSYLLLDTLTGDAEVVDAPSF